MTPRSTGPLAVEPTAQQIAVAIRQHAQVSRMLAAHIHKQTKGDARKAALLSVQIAPVLTAHARASHSLRDLVLHHVARVAANRGGRA